MKAKEQSRSKGKTTVAAKNKELKTEAPISEKDEVKQAEERTKRALKK
jgi:hypothetical protein